MAREYNKAWEEFFDENPNAKMDEVIDYGRTISDHYILEINF